MPAFQIFHGGNSTFFSSTCLIKPNFSVSLLQQYSTTVSLDTRDLFGFINGAIRKFVIPLYYCMLIRPTGLALVSMLFWILPKAAGLRRLISIETKEH